MYLGHFIAWLSASILYAQQLHATPGNTDVLPGRWPTTRRDRRRHLRHCRGLDDGEPDDLPGRPGVPGRGAFVFPIAA